MLYRRVSLEERLRLEDAMSVLDVGCGEGNKLNDLKTTNRICVGLDIEKIKIKNGKREYRSLNFILADACYLPLRQNTFDVVFSIQFVSHVWNLDKALEEMTRVSLNIIYVEDSNILNPIVFFTLLAKLGLNWLLQKGKFKRISKMEDIHSVFWWKRKFRNRITIMSKKIWSNPLLNIGWKYFGSDSIFSFKT